MNLGKAIKLCRIQRDLTQVQLATAATVSVSYLSLLERNRRDPSFSTIESIASVLQVPLIILIFLASDDSEKLKLDPILQEKLAYAALVILQ